MQLQHTTTTFSKKTFPIVLVCDQVTVAANIGSLFRLSDAFGIEKIIFCATIPLEFNRRMEKTARSTHKSVAYDINRSIEDSITDLKKEGYTLVALEITENSKALQQINFQEIDKIALIIGDENYGIQDNILKQCDSITHITMFGTNSSMNVAQAANIALYEITKQWHK